MNSFNQPLPIPATYWSPPDLSQAAFIAPNAVVMGAVEVAFGVSIWYGAVVRGDIERIILGAYTNIQDGAILHGDPGTLTLLEDYVTVGHQAVIHAAHIERGCLIGIGSVILDGVRIGEGSIIGAGSVVTKDIPPFSLVKGIPGQRTGHISEAKAQELIEHAHAYQKLALVHSGRGTELGFPKVNP